MYVYQSTNPCICTPSQTPTPDPECPDECVCLKLCNIVILSDADEAVGPCAATGTLDVTDPSFGHDTCACGTDPLYWSLEHYDSEIFVTAEVTSAGSLTWITKGEETVGKYGMIILKACCGSLSAYLHVLIGVKDLCNCPNCAPCQICNPCDGVCLDEEVDTNLSSGSSTANMTLNASS